MPWYYLEAFLFSSWAWRLQISVIGFTWRGVLTLILICPENMALVRGGYILSVEFIKQFNVMVWLCGLTRYCQYASQFIFEICLIESLWTWASSFQLSLNSFISGSVSESPSLIKLVVWRVWVTVSIIFLSSFVALLTARYACLI